MTVEAMTRRRFVRRAAGAGAALATTASAARRSASCIPFIDIHTHLGTFYYGKPLSVDELLRFMDRHGIERSVILPLVSPEASPYPQTSEAAVAAHRRHPERLIPFCCVDGRCLTVPPQRQGHVAGVKGLIRMLRRYQDAGCRGVGEHKTGLPFDATQNMYLYEACQEVGMPLLFHLDDIRNPDGPGLPRLERVLKRLPELVLIGHAAGFWASISGDATLADFGRYPSIPTPVAPGGALDRLMAKYPNLYGDLSEPGGYRAVARDRAFGRQFLIRRADQLLFGTDVLMPNQKIPQFELFGSLDLPREVAYKIYRGNAMRLLGLEAAH